ncbi:hypothetical protein Tco_0152340 [Tanacetum coccineum]
MDDIPSCPEVFVGGKRLLGKSSFGSPQVLAKKAFKERENRYLEDIVDLEDKLSSHDRIVYKMAGLGYKNPGHLKKAIAAQPKMYDGEMLHSAKLNIYLPDSEETLEDAEESVESSNSVRRQKSKATKSKDRVLKNKHDKRPSKHVRKMSSSVSIDYNKRETMHSNVCWNGYLRKGRKTKPKRQNWTRNGKAWKRQSQDKAQV